MGSDALTKGQIVIVINGEYKGISGIVRDVRPEKCLVELNIWGKIKSESINLEDVRVMERPSWA